MRSATKGLILAVLVPCLMAGTVPAGSLTTFGAASVSGIGVQSGAAVFPGDTITTGASSALFNLSNGRSVQIGPNSALRISKDSVVEIMNGMSRMQAKSGTFVMLASNWKLQGQPDSKNGMLTADVVRELDGKVSLNVSSGKIVANHGAVTMVAEAGHPVMLPSDPPSAPPAGAGSGSGSGSGGGQGSNHNLLVGAIIVGVAGIALGAAALAKDPSDNSSQVAALTTQLATANSQISALQTQSANLLANLNAVAAAAGASANLTAQLNLQIGKLVAAQAALATAQGIINGLVAKLAANGSLSTADQASLAAAQATVTAQTAIISAASTAAAALISQIQQISVPSNFKP
jgi:hypothetical protein